MKNNDIDFEDYFHYSRIMEMSKATEAFSSLSQETRLKVFRLLIEYGREGAVPGVIADEIMIPANTLSFHLSHMSRAGLVTSRKTGRSITYFANTELVEELIGYLRANCCARESKAKVQGKSKDKSCNERRCRNEQEPN